MSEENEKQGKKGRRGKRSVRKEAMWLSLANASVTAMRFFLPVLLVRVLTEETFGIYRMVWLVILTTEMLAPLGVPRSLLYFLPRSDRATARQYTYQSLFLVVGMGLLSGAVAWGVLDWIPRFAPLAEIKTLVAVFLGLWIAGKLVEFLPLATDGAKLQGAFVSGLEVCRVVSLALFAFIYRNLEAVVLTLALFSLFRFLVMLSYLVKRYGFPRWRPRRGQLVDQLSFALPNCLTSFLVQGAKKAEQWIVAFMFNPVEFSIYVIGSLNVPVLFMFRNTISVVITPELSKAESEGNHQRAMDLIRKANTISAFCVFPVSLFMLVYAREVIVVLFTEAYRSAVPILMIYVFNQMKRSVELSNLLMVYRQQGFLFKVSMVTLAGSVMLSVAGGYVLGLPGVTLGATVGRYLQGAVLHWKTMKLFNISAKELQDWKSLFCFVACALGAGYLSYFAVGQVLDIESVLGLAAGMGLAGSLYLALTICCGYGWIVPMALGRRAWK